MVRRGGPERAGRWELVDGGDGRHGVALRVLRSAQSPRLGGAEPRLDLRAGEDRSADRVVRDRQSRATAPEPGDERVAPDAQASDQPGVAACSDAAERGPLVAAGDRDPQLALPGGERELGERVAAAAG